VSQKNPVLYGSRLYGSVLYGITEDFETFNASLSDSTSLSDARVIDTITKALADVLSSADATTVTGTKILTDSATITDLIVKSLTTHFTDTLLMSESDIIQATKVITNALSVLDSTIEMIGTKPLADSSTLSDQIAASIQKILVDAFVIIDNQILSTGTKSLTDFILLKEWITVTLKKINPWQKTITLPPNVPLYGTILYGQVLYGYTPSIVWGKPQASRKSFINRDGEAHQ
jgi:hypothetical protein